MKYEVVYEYKGETYVNSSAAAEVTLLKGENNWSLSVLPHGKIKIVSCRMELDDSLKPGEKFFSNGYQSWTRSRELSFFQKTPKMGILGRTKKFEDLYHFSAYGDSRFRKYRRHASYTLTYFRKGKHFRFYGSESEKNGYTVFYLKGRKLCAEKDDQGQVLEKETELFSIYKAEGSEDEVFDQYLKVLGHGPIQDDQVFGYTSWYRHYEDISEEKILTDLENLKKTGLPFTLFQIDDGYEAKVGDWKKYKPSFPNGLAGIYKKIAEAGFVPGIWLAPFCAQKDSDLVKEHPEYLLRDEKGNPIYMGANWNGTYALDFHNEGLKRYLHEVFQYYISLGVKVFKLDFLYACTLALHEDETRGGLMEEAMEWIRGELQGCKILGCGVPLSAAFFNVDYCRISMDVSQKWNDAWYMRFFHPEHNSTKYAITNIRVRAPFNRRFFLNDPDVVFLHGTEMSPKQKEKLFEAAKKYGGVHLTSDDFALYNEGDIDRWNTMIAEAKKENRRSSDSER